MPLLHITRLAAFCSSGQYHERIFRCDGFVRTSSHFLERSFRPFNLLATRVITRALTLHL